MSLNTRYASIQVSKCMESKRSLRTERIIFDSIETLNARNRMEHSKARHSPAGVY